MTVHPIEPLIKQYLDQKNISKATFKSYTNAFKYYVIYLKKHNIEFAKTSDVIKYREQRRCLGHSAHYLYVSICALKGLYQFLKDNQVRLSLPTKYQYNIMDPIQNERIRPQIRKRVLSKKEAKQLITISKRKRRLITDYRDHAIVYIMLISGLKPKDIMHAKRENLVKKTTQTLLYLEDEKSQAPSFVKLSEGAAYALFDYLNKRKDDNPYLFISHRTVAKYQHLSKAFFQDLLPRVLKNCGLDHLKITPHALRHTAAIMNLKRGASLEATRQFLRHSNIESTMVYLEYLERLEDTSEEAIDALILEEEPFG